MERRVRRTPKYWEDRSLERLSEAEKNALPYLRKIQDAYVEAAKSLTEQIKSMYVAYYRKDKTFDMAKLHQIVPSGDLEVFYHQLARAGITKELPAQYRGRLNRAEMMNAQAWLEVKKAAVKERSYSNRLYTDTINNAYYRTIFDLSKGLKQDLAFNALDSRTTSKILETKFYGANYSERIWRSSDKLADSLQGILSRAIASGQSPEKTVRELQERFGAKKYEAQRLVRTETNYFQTQGELESYKELGIKEIVFVATLDMRTSEICREMDGKRIKIAEAKQGTNAPPLHPNCRSTIRPYVGKEWEPRTRVMRNPFSNDSVKIPNMTYAEWLASATKQTAASSIGRNISLKEIIQLVRPISGGGVMESLGFEKGPEQSRGVALANTNPSRGEDESYQRNCQRCVPVYELRRRGYDVVAAPKPVLNAVRNAQVLFVDPKTGLFPTLLSFENRAMMEKSMIKFPDGARFAVSVTVKGVPVGHVFVAEKKAGRIIYSDPQTADPDCSRYFQKASTMKYFRMDDLQINNNKFLVGSIIKT